MIYEYTCPCGHTWEEDQHMADPPLTRCPSCGRDTAQRLCSGGLCTVFRGVGWTPKTDRFVGHSKTKPLRGDEIDF